MNDALNEEIGRLKRELGAVLLVHNYQCPEVQAVADHLGDSLELSRLAAKVKEGVIVFAGVKFMAETAKILSPDKMVLLPRLDAGCPMADMITLEDLRELKATYPQAMVVTYVNSSAEIKAESDLCCTSANAVSVVRQVPARQVIFVPDKNLGAYVAAQVPEKELILFEGYCYVHNRIKVEEILEMKRRFPTAPVLIHPEAPMAVLQLADAVLSTSGMLAYVKKSPEQNFIVATEQGLLDRMTADNPGKAFLPALRPKICSNMKRTSLEDVRRALVNRQYQIDVPAQVADKARKALSEMLKYT
jgi:quinolinate synthase